MENYQQSRCFDARINVDIIWKSIWSLPHYEDKVRLLWLTKHLRWGRKSIHQALQESWATKESGV